MMRRLFKGQTVRLLMTTAPVLQAKKDAINRYMKAYRETVDFMYTDAGLKDLCRLAQNPGGQGAAHARRLLPQGIGQSGSHHRT